MKERQATLQEGIPVLAVNFHGRLSTFMVGCQDSEHIQWITLFLCTHIIKFPKRPVRVCGV